MNNNLQHTTTPSRNLTDYNRMLPPSNTPPKLRCIFTTMLLFATLFFTSNARAAFPLDSNIARQAYAQAQRWVAAAAVPEQTPLQGLMMVTDLAAVHATLRLDGVRLGHATAIISQPDSTTSTTQETDILIPVAQAVRQALRNSTNTLNLKALFEAKHRLCLDLQFAHTPQKLRLQNHQQLPPLITPGLHGLAMTYNNSSYYLFPGTIIASNINLTSQITRLFSGLKIPVDHFDQIGQPNGPVVYRFNAIQLNKAHPQAQVLQLTRGSLPLPTTPINEIQINNLIKQYTTLLTNRQNTLGLYAGSFNPTPSKFSPPLASLYESAITNFALARAAKLPNLNPATRDAALTTAQLGIEAMLELRSIIEPEKHKLATTAACLIALLETPGHAAHQEQVIALTEDLLFMWHQDISLFRESYDANSGVANIPHQALAAAALTQLFKLNRNPTTQQAASATLTALWENIKDYRSVSRAMPWLAFAELNLADLNVINPRLPQLRQAAEKILDNQVGRNGQEAPADTIGGLDTGEDIFISPTWRTTQVLAGLARSLASNNFVTPDQTPRWLSQCGLAARFINQLTMQPADAYYTLSPIQAINALRFAPHNNRQPLEATATALLAMVELQNAINKIIEATPPALPASPAQK